MSAYYLETKKNLPKGKDNVIDNCYLFKIGYR